MRCRLVRARTVFTTHTPVPAGIDRFSRDLMQRYFGEGGVPTGLSLERLLSLGAEASGDPGVFNMAALGIRMAARVNGVSRLHGIVAREMFAPLFPGVAPDDVPITHITNGVHAETWVGPEFGALYRARLGDGYGTRTEGWERLAARHRRRALRGARPGAAAPRRRGAPPPARCRRASAATIRAERAWLSRGARPAAHSRSASRAGSRPTSA